MTVPYTEWTDDEWVRAMQEFEPDDDIRCIEAQVHVWRNETNREELTNE
jgi:hypothetical protein